MPTYQQIILTSNSTDTAAPTASDISQGELAINLKDGKLYTKDANNTGDIITLNKLASSSATLGDSGIISQHICEDASGVGINTDPAAGIDLLVNGKVKVVDTLHASQIFRDVDNGFISISGGTNDTNTPENVGGADMQLYGANAAGDNANAMHLHADKFFLGDSDSPTNPRYIALGTFEPQLTIGGPNTTGKATLNLGTGRTGDKVSQIIFQSRQIQTSDNANEHLAKIIRDSNASANFRIINHTGHVHIQADNDKAVKLISSTDNSDAIETVNLIAKAGKVKIGSLTGQTGVNNDKELEVVGAIKTQTIQITNESDAITFGANNAHNISYNDENGVFNIRAAHISDQTDDREEFTTANSATYIGSKNLANSAGLQHIELKVSSDTTPAKDAAVNWGEPFKIFPDKLNYQGKVGLGNALSPAADLHVAGDGTIDSLKIETNNVDGTAGAELLLLTSTGTFDSKTICNTGQPIGQIIAQGRAQPTAGGATTYTSAGKIKFEALSTWNSDVNRNAKLTFRVRGTTTKDGVNTNNEHDVMKLFATDGGKVGINCPVDLTDVGSPSLYIGGAQDLGKDKGDFIEHLRLDADSGNDDKLTFRSYRCETDDNTPEWYSASHRIQRIVDVTPMGYIDFRSHADGTSNTGGTKELIIFGEGNENPASGENGHNEDKKFFAIMHDGRLSQYGQDPDTLYHGADDLVIGKADTNVDSGMTIVSDRIQKGNIFFADQDHDFAGTISYDHEFNRLDLSTDSEGYPNNGSAFKGMQIDSTGQVGIRLIDSTPLQALHVNGQILATDDITAFSDERLKENITTIPNALEKVTQLRGVQFTQKDTQKESIGVIAQEIEKVIPEVVVTNDDKNKTKSVAYGNIVGLLIEAVKDLQKEVEELKRNVRQ